MQLDDETMPDPRRAAARHERLRLSAPAVQHDINNAMMILTSNLDLLGRVATEPAPRRQLDRALAATRRIEEMVRGYLDAARRPLEDVASVSPAAAVRTALPLLRVVLGARYGVELAAPEQERAVRLDRAKLDLALLALARDALGRMAHGARIGLRVEYRDDEVALALDLPEGAAPTAEVARLLGEAADRLEDGPVLVWRLA